MSKDYLHKFRRKIDIGGCSQGESETNELRENFNELVDEKLSPTVHTVKYVKRENVGVDINGIEINVNIEDVSENDQKSNDEKYINFKYDLNVESGDQIYWHNTWWVLYHEEKLSVLASKTFTCKKCNFDYHIEVKGIKYHFPTLLMNLTLYSDGMADQTYMSNQDGSRRITIPNNKHSEFIKIGTRIMITKDTIYEVCHIDDFSRPGVKDCMLKQVFFDSKDNKDELIAWNDFNKTEIIEGTNILGEDIIRLGANEIYKHTFPIGTVVGWTLEGVEDNCVYIDENYDNSKDYSVRIKCTLNGAYIGNTVILRATNSHGESITKEIRIGGMF